MKISYFNNVSDTTPKSIRLEEWLSDTMEPSKKLEKLVSKYRLEGNKKDKLKLPCVTISASFKKYRNLDNIKKRNPLICIDIDKDDNPLLDMDLVKELLSKHPSTLYVGYSVSREGIYAIIKISHVDKLQKYFKHFKKKLSNVGVKIDEKCKDYTRLRFFSIDESAYYNPKAVEYKIPKKVRRNTSKAISAIASKSDTDKVEAVVRLIEKHAIDITIDYNDWIKIGAALCNSFGEGGRDYFHRISRFHHDYKVRDCNLKYSQCSKMNRVKLSSFFYVADSFGIRY